MNFLYIIIMYSLLGKAIRKHRHGLWDMYQALRNSKIVFPPDDNELDRIWHEVPESIKYLFTESRSGVVLIVPLRPRTNAGWSP